MAGQSAGTITQDLMGHSNNTFKHLSTFRVPVNFLSTLTRIHSLNYLNNPKEEYSLSALYKKEVFLHSTEEESEAQRS